VGARQDGVVIEDDFEAEFRFDRRSLSAIAGLDPDRVTFSAQSGWCASAPVLLTEPYQFLGVLADQPVIPLTAVVLVLAHRLCSGSVPISNSRAASPPLRPSEDRYCGSFHSPLRRGFHRFR
jgi:hypothetical protein